jgi:hypothetical protein
MKHNANFKYDLEWGKQGETVVGEIQQGEKTEVKSERDKWIKTGNHYCEYQSRGKESGIKKTQAEWWTINFYNITLKTKDLRNIINKNNFNKVPGGDNNTSWGYLIPIIKLIDFNNYGEKK